MIDNWKLLTKLMSVIGLLAVLALGGAIFGAVQILKVDKAYSNLTDERSPAALELVRINRSLNKLSYAAYRTVVYDGASAEAMAAEKAGAEAIEEINASAAKAKALDHKQGPFIDSLMPKLNALTEAGRNVIRAGMINDNDKAKALLQSYDGEVVKLSAEIKQRNDSITKDIAEDSAQLSKDALKAMLVLVGMTTLAIVLGFAVGVWMAVFKISKPLNALAGRMNQLAGGDFSVEVEGQARRDEVGLMAKAVQVFKDNGLKARDLAGEAERARASSESERARNDEERRKNEAEQATVVTALAKSLDRLAQGDLTARIDAEFTGQYAQIRNDFNAAIDSLRKAMTSISATAEGVRGGSNEIASASSDLSRRTEQQAASIEETAAALTEVVSTVKRSAEGAREASRAASGAKAEAEGSGEIMRQAVEAMGEIEQSSAKITSIIGVIDEIAFQTNLLALNAGVEAARAGEAGRGFAVVAQEVRALAQRSADAAKEIKQLISSSSSQVERGAKLVTDTGAALQGIVDKVSQIDLLISEIARSAAEQADSLAEVNTAVNQMDQVTQQNAAMVEEATAAAASLNGEGAELAQLVAKFNVGGGSTASAPTRAASPAAPEPPPKAAPATRPGGHPVHQARQRVAAFAGGGAAAAKSEDWEEF